MAPLDSLRRLGALVRSVSPVASDDDVIDDGDDSQVPVPQESEAWTPPGDVQLRVWKRLPTPEPVPLPRVLRIGARGADVLAVQEALRASGRRECAATGVFGRGTFAAVWIFQSKHGIPASGVYGMHTHKALIGHGWFTTRGVGVMVDGYAAANPRPVKVRPVPSPTTSGSAWRAAVRDRVKLAAQAMVAEGWNAVYSGPNTVTIGLRMQGVRERRTIQNPPRYEDCSSSATWILGVASGWDAECDPNANGYAGWGSTFSMVEAADAGRVQRISPAAANLAGDLVLYGRAWHDTTHVVVATGGGGVFSFGSNPPRFRTGDYRSDAVGAIRVKGLV